MKFLSLILFFTFSANASFRLVFKSKTPNLATFEKEILSVLPKEIKDKLDKTIFIKFESLDHFSEIQSPCEKRGIPQVFGKANRDTIVLNTNFLSVLSNGKSGLDQFKCGHRTYYKLALATVIHELAHLYDSSVKRVSKKNLYLALSHSGKNLLGKAGTKNRKTDRLPDAYELKSPSEHFAVNTEYFLLDPSYSCRRPNLAKYFSKLYQVQQSNCPPNTMVYLYDGNKVSDINLDVRNIKAIHYLLADKGQSIMSRFGHAMFRIEFKNQSQDIVVGFSGEPDDTVINGVKGLTGKYASRLILKPLSAVISEYTKTELRGLTSYPIKMTSKQLESFIHEVIVLYWEYSGRYFFLTTNCATEAMSLLKVSIQITSVINRKTSNPLGMRKILKDSGLISESNSIRFESYSLVLQKLFSQVSSHFSIKDFEEFVSLTARERGDQINTLTSLSKKEILSLLSLELYSVSKVTNSLNQKVMSAIHKFKNNNELKASSESMIRLSNELNFGSTEAQGYGIPLNDEVDSQSLEKAKVSQDELISIMRVFGEWAQESFPALSNEIRLSHENILLLRSKL